MTYRELSVPGAWEITPKQHGDPRGVFLEYFQGGPFAETTGHRFDLQQANCSVSATGVVRGIHFADVPPGQAKYVTCAAGAVLDYVVDIRVGSPTFGRWDSVLLDDTDRRAVYLAEGLGHCFVALTDNATVSYLVTEVFNASGEHGINPLDPEVGLVFPAEAGELLVSPKDTDAPALADAAARCLLPSWAAARAHYGSLGER